MNRMEPKDQARGEGDIISLPSLLCYGFSPGYCFLKLSVKGVIGNSPIIWGSRISVNTSVKKLIEKGDWVDIFSLQNLLCLDFSPRKLFFEIIGERNFLIFTGYSGLGNIGEYLCKQQVHTVDITQILTLFFHRGNEKCEFSVKISALCQPKAENYCKSPILIRKNRPCTKEPSLHKRTVPVQKNRPCTKEPSLRKNRRSKGFGGSQDHIFILLLTASVRASSFLQLSSRLVPLTPM